MRWENTILHGIIDSISQVSYLSIYFVIRKKCFLKQYEY